MNGRPGVPTLLPDAAFLELKGRIIQRTGHFYYQDKNELLWERLLRRMRATASPSSETYLRRLDDPLGGEAEWSALEAEITIGETFFFRYAEQFAALQERILPELIRRNRATRQLRIWSAGCATGAEPYSIAILLHRLLGKEIGGWRCRILGTDINESFLATAREARFSAWALRSLAAGERAQDFAPDPSGRSWQLRPPFRALVRFERHNLLSLLDPAAPLNLSGFDLILCRNVLIYFHPDTVTRLVRALGDRLAPEGWMLLGHAEPNPAFAAFLSVEQLPGTVAYRRPAASFQEASGQEASGEASGAGAEAAPPEMAGATPLVPPWSQPWKMPWQSSGPEAPADPAPLFVPAVWAGASRARAAMAAPLPLPEPVPPAPAMPATEGGPTALERIRELANRGETEAARAACAAALREDPMRAAAHFYDGLLARALGQATEAEAALRRALYLDRNFLAAHYQLGLLLLDLGRRQEGRRAIATAARIARALPGETPVEEGDGMTAANLHALARLQLGLSMS
ncbi:protein-glutamate O-methyltransferase CheR [Roseomonas gilardii subsp. gilardii]|uniref:CheR family methyltransferase n=1 Tax=Roseomonas gilardii TaxID=257708 RepID=UPI001FF71585|nr:protein-glutamate O-methyltransferase CheR [Roseomonas gilardii]UPG73414.1 protein-glutamate O-methyltransferase CheR [Roseomonas gilardii subsp. gilardii]